MLNVEWRSKAPPRSLSFNIEHSTFDIEHSPSNRPRAFALNLQSVATTNKTNARLLPSRRHLSGHRHPSARARPRPDCANLQLALRAKLGMGVGGDVRRDRGHSHLHFEAEPVAV